MKIGDSFSLSWNNLIRRKGRTFLTALGVAIGTASIIAMLSLGIGLKQAAVKSFEQFSDVTILDVRPSYNPNPSGSGGEERRITTADINNLKSLPGVEAVSPVEYLRGENELSMGRRVGRPEVIGLDTKEAKSFGHSMAQGQFFTGLRNEAVISYMLPDIMMEKKKKSRFNKDEDENNNYFYYPMPGEEGNDKPRLDMYGKNLTLTVFKRSGTDNNNLEKKAFKVRVVGMLQEGKGSYSPTIYLPLEMVQEMNKWLGNSAYSGGENKSSNKREASYDQLQVKIGDRSKAEDIVNGIRAIGLDTWSPLESIKEMNQFFLVIQIVLGGIGAISLLVASIGIMNTMIMSILERTKEIGVMKVIGATIPNIQFLFLLEAGMIGLIGGLCGLTLGYTAVFIVNSLPVAASMGLEAGNKIAVVPLWLAIFGISFSIFIGIVSGLYPAHRASRISPLQAIRQE